MLEENFISQEEYNKAINEKIKFTNGKSQKTEKISKQSYFIQAVVEELKKDLVETMKYSYGLAEKNVYNNGYKIYTTIDIELQKSFDKIFTDKNNFPTLRINNKYHTQSAGIIIDNKTGYIKAYGWPKIKI